jgi:adenylyl-sulfate kinase
MTYEHPVSWHEAQNPLNNRFVRTQLFRDAPRTLWLTGLSGAGKSTLAYGLESRLLQEGRPCYVLDGDNLRHGLNRNLGFSSADRSENIRRIAEVAHLMNRAGLIVIAALISPMEADRHMARDIIGKTLFYEIYVSTPVATCERRDPKGLYKRARAGDLLEFTGVSAPYQAPSCPAVTVDTTTAPIEQSIIKILVASNLVTDAGSVGMSHGPGI